MASIFSRNPMENNYLALFISIVWYRELTPEESFRIIEGNSKMKPECRKITPEMIERMHKITSSKNFRSWDKLEYTFKVNRRKIVELLKEYRNSQNKQVLSQ